jgi:ribosomal protein S18 acetylase RimI-like enzyme
MSSPSRNSWSVSSISIYPRNEQLRVVPPGAARDAYWDLLLLADESELAVRSYYQQGDLFVYEEAKSGGRSAEGAAAVLGIVLVIPDDDATDGTVELKAVAVTPERHGQRIGQRMLAAVLAALRQRGVPRVIVGTGNSGIGQLAFYQKAGFRLSHIERDFFSPERGYPDGIEENGIPLRDMVWMDQRL